VIVLAHVLVLLDGAERRERAHRETAPCIPRQAGQAGNELDVDDGAVFPDAAPDTKQEIRAAGEGCAGVSLVGEKAKRFRQGRGFEDGKDHVSHPNRRVVYVSHTGTYILYVKRIVAHRSGVVKTSGRTEFVRFRPKANGIVAIVRR